MPIFVSLNQYWDLSSVWKATSKTSPTSFIHNNQNVQGICLHMFQIEWFIQTNDQCEMDECNQTFIISSSPEQMASILAKDIFKYIFLNENYRIPTQISLKSLGGGARNCWFVFISISMYKCRYINILWSVLGRQSFMKPYFGYIAFTSIYSCGCEDIALISPIHTNRHIIAPWTKHW